MFIDVWEKRGKERGFLVDLWEFGEGYLVLGDKGKDGNGGFV